MPRSSSANSQDVDVEVDVQPVKVKSKRRHMTNDSSAKDIKPHKDKKRKVQKMRMTETTLENPLPLIALM